MPLALLDAAHGPRPRPWLVRPELVDPRWRWLWPHVMSAVPCWERSGRPRDVAVEAFPTWAAPAWGHLVIGAPAIAAAPVVDCRSTGPTFADHPRYRRATRAVTVMVLVYRPSSGVSAGNFDQLFLKNKAPTDFVSWGLLQSSTTSVRHLFGVSTTTAVNQVASETTTGSANTWYWIVGQWFSGGEVRCERWSLSGSRLSSTNPFPPAPGGTLIYDTGSLALGGYDAYYGCAYAFSTYLSQAQIAAICRDPWGLVRRGQGTSGLVGTAGSGAGGGSSARVFVAGLIG